MYCIGLVLTVFIPGEKVAIFKSIIVAMLQDLYKWRKTSLNLQEFQEYNTNISLSIVMCPIRVGLIISLVKSV